MAEDKDKSNKGQWHGGKGSVQKSSGQDKYAENYDKIFNKKLNTDYSLSEQMQDELEPIPSKKRKLSKREEVLMDPLAASQRSDKKKKEKNKFKGDSGPNYEGPWGKDLGLK